MTVFHNDLVPVSYPVCCIHNLLSSVSPSTTVIPRDDTTADSTVAIIVATDYSVNEGASVVVTLEVTGDFTGDIIVTVMAVIEADDTAGIMYGC